MFHSPSCLRVMAVQPLGCDVRRLQFSPMPYGLLLNLRFCVKLKDDLLGQYWPYGPQHYCCRARYVIFK